MERNTFNVVFYCKRTKVTSKGKAPIYARITTRCRTTEVYTQCQIEPEKWNQKAERSLFRDKVSMQINDIIATYRANILQVYDQLIKEGKEPNCFAIKQQLLDPRAGSMMFLAELATYCEKRQKEVPARITQLTANKYHRLLRYLREYTLSEYRKEDIFLDQVSYEYIDGFNSFLQTVKTCKNNGAVNLLCCMKNFILYTA